MAQVLAAVGSFTVTSATQFEITDATAFGGETPKGVLLWAANNTTTDTVQDDGYFGMWGCTQDTIRGSSMRYRHNVASSYTNRVNSSGSSSTTATVRFLANNSTSSTLIMETQGDGTGSNPGPITNGWRFDVTTYTNDVVFNYLLVGGADLEVFSRSKRVNDASETFLHELSKTDRVLGWTWFQNEEAATGVNVRTSTYNSYGMFATNDGGTSFQQWAVGQREVNGSTQQDIVSSFHNDACIAVATVDTGHANGNTFEGDVTAIDSTNITFSRTFWNVTPGSEPGMYMWGISIPSSMNVWVGNYTLPTSGGTFTPSSQPGFTPGVYGIMATGHTNVSDYEYVEGGGAWSYGIQDEDGNKKSASIIVEGEMLTSENTYARSLTSTNFLDSRTVSSETESTAAQFSSATFIATGIEVASPTGTFGGYAGAFAFELDAGTPIEVSATESLAFTDSASETLTVNETITESLAFSETATGVATGSFNETITETLAFTDSATGPKVSPFNETLTETLTFTETVTPGYEAMRTSSSGATIQSGRELKRREWLQMLQQRDRALIRAIEDMVRKQ